MFMILRTFIFSFLIGISFLASPASTFAHSISRGVGTAIIITFKKDKIHILYDVGFGPNYARQTQLKMDKNRDFKIDEKEAKKYRDAILKKHIEPGLVFTLNDHEFKPRLVKSYDVQLEGEVADLAFDFYYEFEIEVPFATDKDRQRRIFLKVKNDVLKQVVTNTHLFIVPYSGHVPEVSYDIILPEPILELTGYQMFGPQLEMAFDYSKGNLLKDHPAQFLLIDGSITEAKPYETEPEESSITKINSQTTDVETQKPPPISESVETEEKEKQEASDAFLANVIQRDDLNFWGQLGFILLAFIYGLGHALTPGHGKSMVSTYLMGTKGRMRDVLLLGGITTLTHTFCVCLIALIIHIILEEAIEAKAFQDNAIVFLRIAGSTTLVLIGGYLFFKRVEWMGHPERMTNHSHSNEDPASSPTEVSDEENSSSTKPNVLNLLWVGMVGGLVPCTGALSVLAFGLLYPERRLFSFLLLLVFSLGLGTVLIAIGSLLISGKTMMLAGSLKKKRTFSYAPGLSALLLTGLGAFYLVLTLKEHGSEFANWFITSLGL